MSNPWSFFKNIYVISSKEDKERRTYMKEMLEKQGIKHTMIDAVNGKKNPHLRQSYQDRGIINEYNYSGEVLGCLASHRLVWEQILHESDSSDPTWSLIMEDDVKFHPLLTKDRLTSYLETVPKDAMIIKLGYLGDEVSKYIPVNKYWTSFQDQIAYSTICYGIRSDLLRHLLKHKWSTPIDHIRIPHCYGMINIEDIEDLPVDTSFRYYINGNINPAQLFHGMAAEHTFETQILEAPKVPETKKWMICYPGGGISDIFYVITSCLMHAEKYKRTLVVDTRRIEWFKESIHDFIDFQHESIYVGNLDTLYESLNQQDTFPPEVKGDLSTFYATHDDTTTGVYYKNVINMKLNLERDYKETVLVYSSRAFSRNASILNYSCFKEPIISVYRERIAKLPSSYIGIHVRNTDHASDVPIFLETHKEHLHSPFFLACDNKMTIDEIKYKYKHAITFSLIPYSITNDGLHYMKRDKEENKQFIIDSYVDLLLLASASEVFVSCPNSGYSQLAKALCSNKRLLHKIIDTKV